MWLRGICIVCGMGMLRGVWLVVMADIWSCEERRVGGLMVYIVDISIMRRCKGFELRIKVDQ